MDLSEIKKEVAESAAPNIKKLREPDKSLAFCYHFLHAEHYKSSSSRYMGFEPIMTLENEMYWQRMFYKKEPPFVNMDLFKYEVEDEVLDYYIPGLKDYTVSKHELFGMLSILQGLLIRNLNK